MSTVIAILSQKKTLFWLVGIISVSFLTLYYGAFYVHHYVAAPGGDMLGHYHSVHELRALGIRSFFLHYPKFFHAILLLIVSVTGLPVITAALYLIPVVLLGVALATGWAAYRLGGKVAGLTAFILALFAAGQPLQTLYDGGFPNTIAGHIFLPISVVCLGMYLEKRERSWLIGWVLSTFLILATHGFTAVYTGLIELSVLLYYPKSALRYGLIGLAAVIALILSPLGSVARVTIERALAFSPTFPWIKVVGHLDSPSAIWRFVDYPVGIGQFIVYAGILGLGYLAVKAFRQRSQGGPLAFLVLTWALLLLIGSRVEMVGFPVRLARDAGTPLLISAAVLVGFLWAQKTWWIRVAVIAIVIWLSWPIARYRYEKVLRYDPVMQYTEADAQAVAYVGSEPTTTINQPFAATIKPTVVEGYLYVKKSHYADLTGNITKTTFALFELKNGVLSEPYEPYLASLGYKRVAEFHDPLKTVVVMKK